MGKNNKNLVHLVVDKNYFDNCFEPERRRLQTKLGISNLSQAKFTAYLHASKNKINIQKRNKFTSRGFRLRIWEAY